jgi:hypothetical protein
VKTKEFRGDVQRRRIVSDPKVSASMNFARQGYSLLPSATQRSEGYRSRITTGAVQVLSGVGPMKFERCYHAHVAVLLNRERSTILLLREVERDEQPTRKAKSLESDDSPTI